MTDDAVWPTDKDDKVECCDISEEPEFRLTIKLDCVVDRLGGRTGSVWLDTARLGSGGGATLFWSTDSSAGGTLFRLGLGGTNGLLGLGGLVDGFEATGTGSD